MATAKSHNFVPTSKTRWARPLDGHEKLYLAFGQQGYEHGLDGLAITSSVVADVPASWTYEMLCQRVRVAWQALRFRFPSIAMSAGKGQMVYEVPASPDQVESWITESLHIHHNDAASFDSLLAQGKIVHRLHLHVIVKTTRDQDTGVAMSPHVELVMRCPHVTADMVSIFCTMDKFIFFLASSPDPSSFAWGTEVDRLPLSFEEAANCPPVASLQSRADATRFLKSYLDSFPSLGLPYNGPAKCKPQAMLSATLTLSEHETTAVIAACKAKGYTVNAAAIVALVHMQLQRLPAQSKYHGRPWCGGAALNMRSLLPPQRDPEAYSAAPYVTATDTIVDPRQDFHETASWISVQWKSRKSPATLEGLAEWARQGYCVANPNKLPLLWLAVKLSPRALLRVIFKWGGKVGGVTMCGLSAVGLIDNYIKPARQLSAAEDDQITVRDIRFALTGLGNQAGTYLWTWQGRMTMTVCWQSAYQGPDFGKLLLQDWKSMLFSRLGLVHTEDHMSVP